MVCCANTALNHTPTGTILGVEAVMGMDTLAAVHLVQEQPLALGSHQCPLFTQSRKVNIIMIWLGWPERLLSHCLHDIQQEHGVNGVCDFPRCSPALHAHLCVYTM